MIESGQQSVFYVSHQGTEQGPFDINEILLRLQNKQLLDIDYMFVEAQEDWISIGEFLSSQGIEFSPAEVTAEINIPNAETAVEASPNQSDENAQNTNASQEPPQPATVYEEPQNLPNPSEMNTTSDNEEELSASQQISLADISPPDDSQMNQAQDNLKKIEDVNTATNIKAANEFQAEFEDEDTQPNAQIQEDTQPTEEQMQMADVQTQVGVEAVSEQEQSTSSIENGSAEPPTAAPPATPPPKSPPEVATTPTIPEANAPEGMVAAEPVVETSQEVAQDVAQDQTPQNQISEITQTSSAPDNGAELTQSVELKNGEADIEIDSNFAGRLVLSLDAEEDVNVDLSAKKEIQVAAGQATKLVIFGPTEIYAGETITMNVLAHDDFGNLDVNFSGEINLNCNEVENLPCVVSINAGVATVNLNPTKAGKTNIKIDSSSVNIPTPEHFEFTVAPGPASQLLIDSPEELPAGQTLKVKIKAVDQYGNPTQDFSGKVQLKIRGAVTDSAESQEQNTAQKPSKSAPNQAS